MHVTHRRPVIPAGALAGPAPRAAHEKNCFPNQIIIVLLPAWARCHCRRPASLLPLSVQAADMPKEGSDHFTQVWTLMLSNWLEPRPKGTPDQQQSGILQPGFLKRESVSAMASVVTGHFYGLSDCVG
jgi:hypothetical protein